MEWLNIMVQIKKKEIIYNHVYSSNGNSKVHLNVYYRNCKLENLLVKNSPPREPEANDHCVYRYTCNEGQCNLSYIGCTQCKLKQRFSKHAQNGSIKNHTLERHSTQKVKTKELLVNVSILHRYNVNSDLNIAEAMYIPRLKPQKMRRANFVMVR